MNFSSRLDVFFAMSDGQAVPRRHDVEETILFSLALSFHSYPGLSGFRALPLQVFVYGKGPRLEEPPSLESHHFDAFLESEIEFKNGANN